MHSKHSINGRTIIVRKGTTEVWEQTKLFSLVIVRIIAQHETIKWGIFYFIMCNRMIEKHRMIELARSYNIIQCKPLNTEMSKLWSPGMKWQWQKNTVTLRSLRLLHEIKKKKHKKTYCKSQVCSSVNMNRIKRMLPKHCSIWFLKMQQDFYLSWVERDDSIYLLTSLQRTQCLFL